MTPRELYYKFLSSTKILDTLSLIDSLSYTDKLSILKRVFYDREPIQNFTSSEMNVALQYYEQHYIKLHRVNDRIIDKTLLGLCKLVRENGKI